MSVSTYSFPAQRSYRWCKLELPFTVITHSTPAPKKKEYKALL